MEECGLTSLPLGGALSDDRLADLAEVMGQNAQADPAFHARQAMVAAATQPEGPLEHTDAAFDPGPEPGCSAESRPVLPSPPLRTARAGFGDGHARHPGLGGVLLIRRGGEGPVRRGGVGWVSELDLMVVQAHR